MKKPSSDSIQAYKIELSNSIPIEKLYGDFDTYFNSFEATYTEIIEHIKPSDTILDVGCGPGIMIDYLDRQGYEINGFDNFLYNPDSELIVESFGKESIIKNCEIKNYIFEKSYDVIVISNVVEHLDDWEKCLDILDQHLNQNGRIILMLPNYSFPFEVHFMIPIIISKSLTYSLFKKSISIFEDKYSRHGLWDSLNFIKPNQISRFYTKRGYTIFFDKKYMIKFIRRSISRSHLKDSVFSDNILRNFLVSLSKLLLETNLLRFFSYLPLSFHPFIKIIASKDSTIIK